MATDYDAPRRNESDEVERGLAGGTEGATQRGPVRPWSMWKRTTRPSPSSSPAPRPVRGEELTIKVIPKQADEFTCSVCFLVQHRSRLASDKNGRLVCVDCA